MQRVSIRKLMWVVSMPHRLYDREYSQRWACTFHRGKGSIHQEDLTVVHVYPPNDKLPISLKQKLKIIKGIRPSHDHSRRY